MGKVFVWIFLTLWVGATAQDATESLPGVADLVSASFHDNIGTDNHILIEFYAPWCGWCKKLIPVWKELGEVATSADTNVKIAKFDATQDGAAAIKEGYGIRGFPTILLFTAGSLTPVKFEGERSRDGFIKFIKEKSGVDLLNPTATPDAPEPKLAPTTRQSKEPEGLVVLNDDNFDQVVLDAKKDVFVKFFAPWCGHCIRMAPAWEALANEVKGVTVAELDCAKYGAVGQRFGVRGFPTLKLFTKTDKTGGLHYKGARDLAAMRAYVASQVQQE